MDEKDGAFNDDFNKLSLDDDNCDFDLSIDLNGKNSFNLYEQNDDADTIDSVHKDIFSKLNLR